MRHSHHDFYQSLNHGNKVKENNYMIDENFVQCNTMDLYIKYDDPITLSSDI